MFDSEILRHVRKKMRARVTEDSVESYLVRCVTIRKGIAIKLMFLTGWPDRLVLLPGARVLFIELKRPVGGRDEPAQPRIQRTLRKLGFTVLKLNTKDAVDEAMEQYAD